MPGATGNKMDKRLCPGDWPTWLDRKTQSSLPLMEVPKPQLFVKTAISEKDQNLPEKICYNTSYKEGSTTR